MSAATAWGKPEGFKDHHTVSEMASFLGVSGRTVERWYVAGTIPAPAKVTDDGWKLWSPAQVTEILRRELHRRKSDGRTRKRG